MGEPIGLNRSALELEHRGRLAFDRGKQETAEASLEETLAVDRRGN